MVKEREEARQEAKKLKKDLEEVVKVLHKKKEGHRRQLNEMKGKVDEYKSKVRVANEKIQSLATKITHIELEYRQEQ